MAKKLSSADLKIIEEFKKRGNIPKHIAIIMDGNGRWARKRNLPRAVGHQRGIETVREMLQASSQLGVKFLTLYTFSTENWKRPQDEVTTLMRLIVKSLQNETDELNSNDIRLTVIGNIKSLPEVVQKELNEAIEKTKNNKKMVLNLALSYGGRWELIKAVKNIMTKFENGEITKEDVTEKLISENLDTKDMPDPDLLIRSGGEFRISNFLLWQIAYSEIFISDVLWPEFKCKHLLNAISDYQTRERRFGLVSEQISKNHDKNQNVKKLSKQAAKL